MSQPSTKQRRAKRRYGQGRVRYQKGRYRAFIPDGHGSERFSGSVPTTCGGCMLETCEAYLEADRLRKSALIAAGEVVVGTTLRELGPLYLASVRKTHRSHRSLCFTFYSVICEA